MLRVFRRLAAASMLLVAGCLELEKPHHATPEAVTTVSWDELCEAQAKHAARCGRDDGKGEAVITTRCLRAHDALKDLVADADLRKMIDCPVTHAECDDSCAEAFDPRGPTGSNLAAAKIWCDEARDKCSDDDVRISCKVFKKKPLTVMKDARWASAVDTCREEACSSMQACIDGIAKDTLDTFTTGVVALSPLLKSTKQADDEPDDDAAPDRKKKRSPKGKPKDKDDTDDTEKDAPATDGPFELVQGVHVGMTKTELKALPKKLVLSSKGKVERFRPHVSDGTVVGVAFEANERGCTRLVDALKKRFPNVDPKTTNGKDILVAGTGAERTRVIFDGDHKRCTVEQGDPPSGD